MLLRTLIVEDNGIAAIYLKKQLEQIGAEDIEIVMSGEEAVQKASSCEFDVIFMDIRLKGEMDGIEAAGIILGHKPVRLIFLTGNSDLPTKERALQLNPDAYLEKPVSTSELREALHELPGDTFSSAS